MSAHDLPSIDTPEDEQIREQKWAFFEIECRQFAESEPDGWSAVRFLEAYRPKFAVLDLTTLGDDSLDVLELIRRAPRLRDLSLVVHVAVPDAGAAADGFHAQAYLTRGINWPGMRAEAERFVQ